jgi:hypothetical protein
MSEYSQQTQEISRKTQVLHEATGSLSMTSSINLLIILTEGAASNSFEIVFSASSELGGWVAEFENTCFASTRLLTVR